MSSPIETNVKISLLHGKLNSRTNVCQSRATVTAPLEFLHKWMPLHLLYTITILVCKKKNTKIALPSEQLSLSLPCGSEAINDVITVALLENAEGMKS